MNEVNQMERDPLYVVAPSYISPKTKRFGKYIYLLFRLVEFNWINIKFNPKKESIEAIDLIIVYPNNDQWILSPQRLPIPPPGPTKTANASSKVEN